MNIQINEYLDEKGNSPYRKWLSGLRDKKAKAIIGLQVDKMGIGLLGDPQPIGEGLSELRIHYGPGYRVYYGRESKKEYLLLCGGDKSTQKKDISRAKYYWADYQERKHRHENEQKR